MLVGLALTGVTAASTVIVLFHWLETRTGQNQNCSQHLRHNNDFLFHIVFKLLLSSCFLLGAQVPCMPNVWRHARLQTNMVESFAFQNSAAVLTMSNNIWTGGTCLQCLNVFNLATQMGLNINSDHDTLYIYYSLGVPWFEIMTWPEAGHFLALFLELVYSRSRFAFLSQSTWWKLNWGSLPPHWSTARQCALSGPHDVVFRTAAPWYIEQFVSRSLRHLYFLAVPMVS